MIAPFLSELHRRGVTFTVSGDTIRWRAPTGAIGAQDIHRLRSDKAALLDLLNAWEERAAIMEFDGEMLRSEAEGRAWEDVTEHREK